MCRKLWESLVKESERLNRPEQSSSIFVVSPPNTESQADGLGFTLSSCMCQVSHWLWQTPVFNWWAEPANGRQTIGKRKAREGLDADKVLTFPGSKSPQPPPYPVTISGLNLSNEILNLSPSTSRGFSNGFSKSSFASVKRPGNWCWWFVPKTLPLTFKLASPHLCLSRV